MVATMIPERTTIEIKTKLEVVKFLYELTSNELTQLLLDHLSKNHSVGSVVKHEMSFDYDCNTFFSIYVDPMKPTLFPYTVVSDTFQDRVLACAPAAAIQAARNGGNDGTILAVFLGHHEDLRE